MDCSSFLSFTNSQSLLKLMSIESVMPFHYLILCYPLFLLPSIFPSIRVFLMSQFFTSVGQNIRASASASVLPMNIQDWFPLVLTGLISLQSMALSRVFSNTTVQKHQLNCCHLSNQSPRSKGIFLKYKLDPITCLLKTFQQPVN